MSTKSLVMIMIFDVKSVLMSTNPYMITEHSPKHIFIGIRLNNAAKSLNVLD